MVENETPNRQKADSCQKCRTCWKIWELTRKSYKKIIRNPQEKHKHTNHHIRTRITSKVQIITKSYQNHWKNTYFGYWGWYSAGLGTLKFSDAANLEGLTNSLHRKLLINCERKVPSFLIKKSDTKLLSFAPRWLSSRWSISCRSSSVTSSSCIAIVPTWRPWRESRTWSHGCWRPWKLWAIPLRQL